MSDSALFFYKAAVKDCYFSCDIFSNKATSRFAEQNYKLRQNFSNSILYR